MSPEPVPAKLNLALLVGERRADGLHEIVTVMQRIDLCDWIAVEPAEALAVDGFAGDTLVAAALAALADEAGVEPHWRVRLEKHVPVAAGLGGGSADAAAALRLANATLAQPVPPPRLATLAFRLGSDVPFFLAAGPKLAEGAGETLTPLDLPQDYWVLIALPIGSSKQSTADVYRRFDELGGGPGFARRKQKLLESLADCRTADDLGRLPSNDLAAASGSVELVDRIQEAGAFRADVSGAGPAVYGLFVQRGEAESAARRLKGAADVHLTVPVW